MEIEKAYKFLDDLETLFLEYPIVADWFMEIRDRKDTADTPQTDCGWGEPKDE